MRCPLCGGDDEKKKNYLPSVSGVLLRGVQRDTCVARWVCTQVRMWLDTTGILWLCCARGMGGARGVGREMYEVAE